MNSPVKRELCFTLNGIKLNEEVLLTKRVVDYLRDDKKLTGTKIGCGEGECGACTVLLDGRNVNSCLLMMGQIENREIITIEHAETLKNGKALQKAFVEAGAIQCGYCTPGMIMAGIALLKENPKPSREEITEGISGNLCRCTGYKKIIEAIETVSSLYCHRVRS